MFRKIFLFLLFIFITSHLTGLQVSAQSFGVQEEKTYRTLVPIRMISEAFNVSVDWNANTKQVTIDQFTLTLGSKSIKQAGQVVKEMDSIPKVINNSVYVPLRDVGFIFNTPVNWNQQKGQVEFEVNGQPIHIPVYAETFVKRPKVSYTKQTISAEGKNFSVNVVTVNLLAPNTSLHVEVAKDQLGSVESLASIAKRHGAIAAINGNYFDAYSDNTYRQIYNGLVMNGKLMQTFDKKFSVFYTMKDGQVGILPGAKFMELFERGDVQEAIQVGPRLVTNGAITVNPIEEGFNSHKILSSPGARSAIGIVKNRQVLLVTTSGATVTQLATIMQKLGAIDAMNSDGGASSGLIMNGNYITSPGRQIAVTLLAK
ncbi:phosphodiester glycosidase family protein [Lysinibacillus antri]|uniref:Copper amine oxidase n=1 Tax=Lysinibacillus antri TaxID=2498145 RepID=A0A3S0PSP7_9BACI|nr:phosphodiester glycosidase family protein [Lysinibacillus antri]RUL57107.1 copper amine oxidase [Lysinibacillus antri]